MCVCVFFFFFSFFSPVKEWVNMIEKKVLAQVVTDEGASGPPSPNQTTAATSPALPHTATG